MGYSLLHVLRHARKHSESVDVCEALGYALSTESACVASATGVEYLFGLVSKQTPFSPIGLAIRGIGLIPAFALGLVAMSGLSYFHNKEAGRFLADSNSLGFVFDYLGRQEPTKDEGVTLNGNKLKIASGSSLTITEKEVPRSLRPLSNEGDSLYVVTSPVCRYDLHSRNLIMCDVEQCFKEIPMPIRRVENIFRHSH